MIVGTIRNTVNQMQLMNQWETKKASGNLLQKEKKNTEMTADEQMLQHFKEQLASNRESEEYSYIYNKMASGQELTNAELDKLRRKNPQAYMEYKADRMEAEAYERRLKNCKTKEEAERLHVNKMNGKLAELKSVTNNPNIPKGEKLKAAQRILGDTVRTAEVYHAFTKSVAFQELPTEEEVMESRRAEQEMREEEILSVKPVQEETKFDTESIRIEDTIADNGKAVGQAAVHAGTNTDEPVNLSDSVTEHADVFAKSAGSIVGDADVSAKRHDRVTEQEKAILTEMFALREQHFGSRKRNVQIDVAL